MRLLIIFLFSPLYFFGQTSFNGTVINTKTKAMIPFATIGLMKENIGTNANEDGSFSLISRTNKANDTLIISCIGFITQKLPVDGNNKTNVVIELTEQFTILNEIVIKNKINWTTITLNEFSKCGNNFLTTNGYQTQLAQHFKVDKNNSLLTEIKICRRSMSIIDPDKTIFRIRIYDIDTLTRSPSTDLCDKIIEIKTNGKFINLNVEKYRIFIPNKDFFIAIEWLKIPYNENKRKAKVNGKEFEYITYSPSIGLTNNINKNMEVWMLDYNNYWRPMLSMNNKTSVSISATVKY